MLDNLGDDLGNLGLSIGDDSQQSDPMNGYPWWCWWGCMGVSCHGATKSSSWCNAAPCANGTQNLNEQCAYGTSNYNNTQHVRPDIALVQYLGDVRLGTVES